MDLHTDEIRSILAKLGVDVDFEMTPEEGYSETTRKRALWPRVEKAFRENIPEDYQESYYDHLADLLLEGKRSQVGQNPITPEMSEDYRFARLAIEVARKSISENDGRAHPFVGAVIVKNGEILATAFRGEQSGNHAEYYAMEKKLSDAALAGATVYTTLEPCTTRNHPKIPCADRLVERKVARVVIGMLDPDHRISGQGQRRLRKANIATAFFPPDLMTEVEEMNREFARQCEMTTDAKQDSGRRKPDYSLQFESRPARLGVALPVVRELRLMLHNGSLHTLDKYRIDLEVPAALLEHDTALYVHELHERRSPGYRFFRIPSRDQKAVTVHPEDTEQVFAITLAISRAGVAYSGLSLQAKLHIEGNSPVSYKLNAEELFAPASSAHFLNPTVS